jgi:hypothetical protein
MQKARKSSLPLRYNPRGSLPYRRGTINMNNISKTTLIAFLQAVLLLLPAAAPAGSYKWVDEDGNTVYSQSRPPADARNVERVKEAPRPTEDPATASERTRQQSEALNERRDARNTETKDKKTAEDKEGQRKQVCEQLQKNLEVLTTKPIVRKQAEDGEMVVLDTEQRETEVKDVRKRIQDAGCT